MAATLWPLRCCFHFVSGALPAALHARQRHTSRSDRRGHSRSRWWQWEAGQWRWRGCRDDAGACGRLSLSLYGALALALLALPRRPPPRDHRRRSRSWRWDSAAGRWGGIVAATLWPLGCVLFSFVGPLRRRCLYRLAGPDCLNVEGDGVFFFSCRAVKRGGGGDAGGICGLMCVFLLFCRAHAVGGAFQAAVCVHGTLCNVGGFAMLALIVAVMFLRWFMF